MTARRVALAAVLGLLVVAGFGVGWRMGERREEPCAVCERVR